MAPNKLVQSSEKYIYIYILKCLINPSKTGDENSSHYGKHICIGNFNPEIPEDAVKDFCDLHKLKTLVRGATCLKNPGNLNVTISS